MPAKIIMIITMMAVMQIFINEFNFLKNLGSRAKE